MNGRGFITISMHELERVKIIEAHLPSARRMCRADARPPSVQQQRNLTL